MLLGRFTEISFLLVEGVVNFGVPALGLCVRLLFEETCLCVGSCLRGHRCFQTRFEW